MNNYGGTFGALYNAVVVIMKFKNILYFTFLILTITGVKAFAFTSVLSDDFEAYVISAGQTSVNLPVGEDKDWVSIRSHSTINSGGKMEVQKIGGNQALFMGANTSLLSENTNHHLISKRFDILNKITSIKMKIKTPVSIIASERVDIQLYNLVYISNGANYSPVIFRIEGNKIKIRDDDRTRYTDVLTCNADTWYEFEYILDTKAKLVRLIATEEGGTPVVTELSNNTVDYTKYQSGFSGTDMYIKTYVTVNTGLRGFLFDNVSINTRDYGDYSISAKFIQDGKETDALDAGEIKAEIKIVKYTANNDLITAYLAIYKNDKVYAIDAEEVDFLNDTELSLTVPNDNSGFRAAVLIFNENLKPVTDKLPLPERQQGVKECNISDNSQNTAVDTEINYKFYKPLTEEPTVNVTPAVPITTAYIDGGINLKFDDFLSGNTSYTITVSGVGFSYTHSFKTMNVINVLSYGAVANDNIDDSQAVKSAAAASKTFQNGVTLFFPNGKYNLKGEQEIYYFKNNNITIMGDNAELIIDGENKTAVSISTCNNVTVKGITVNWDKEYFSHSTIVSTIGLTMRVRINDEFPLNTAMKIEGLLDYDPISLLPIGNIDAFASGITNISYVGDRMFDITLKNYYTAKNQYLTDVISRMNAGNTMILLRHAIYGSYALDINGCNNVLLKDINVRNVPGMGIHATRCEGFKLRNIEIKPPAGKAMSTTADGCFLMFMKGRIDVDDCIIEANGDDCFALSLKFMEIIGSNYGNNSVTAKIMVGWEGPQPAAGDVLRFYKYNSMAEYAERTVSQASWDSVSGIFTITFTQALPPDISANDCMVNLTYNPSLRMMGTSLGKNRSRAMVCSANDVVIDNCLFQYTGMQGLMLYADRMGSHHPGPVCENITVKNSVFKSCGFTSIFSYTGAGSGNTPGKIQKNINITGNSFYDESGLFPTRAKYFSPADTILFYKTAIHISAIDEGTISNNNFVDFSYPVYIGNTKDVTISGNSAVNGKILIDRVTSSDTIITDNTGMTEQPDLTGFNTAYTYYSDTR